MLEIVHSIAPDAKLGFATGQDEDERDAFARGVPKSFDLVIAENTVASLGESWSAHPAHGIAFDGALIERPCKNRPHVRQEKQRSSFRESLRLTGDAGDLSARDESDGSVHDRFQVRGLKPRGQ